MDLNRASVGELTKLPGVGKVLATRIAEGRPYRRLVDVSRVEGITDDLLDRIREAGGVVGKPDEKLVGIGQRGDVTGLDDPIAYAFDDNDTLVATFVPGRGDIDLPETLIGKTLTVYVGEDEVASPTTGRLARGGFVQRRFLVPIDQGPLDLGDWLVDPSWFKTSCCRVKGKAVKQFVLPDGTVKEVPLCHARVEICEVDRSLRFVVDSLTFEGATRLKREILDLAADPVTAELPARETQAVDTARRRELLAVEPTTELRALAGKLTPARTATAIKDVLIADIVDLKVWWCWFDWLTWNYSLDCVKTADLGEDGRFDTDIMYYCHGDKPDLYFRVQQECAGDDWETVHAPNIACNTHWDYCCGDEVRIVVTNPDAAHGPSSCSFPHDPEKSSSVGEWDSLPDSEVFVVHANLLASGKILLFSGGSEAQLPLESRVWDPATGTVTGQLFADDLFCAHQVALDDGRILVMGGSFYDDSIYEHPHGRGIKASYTFDPTGETWTKRDDMKYGRWYPTAVTMPGGDVLTFSGRDEDRAVVEKVERFDPAANTWSTLPGSAKKPLEIYPSMHLLKDGTVFYTGCRWQGSNNRAWPNPPDTAVFDPATNKWSDVGPHVVPNRTEGASVLLPPIRAGVPHGGHDEGPEEPSDQRVLVLGGEGAVAADRSTAEIIDMSDPMPVWQQIADMHYRRVNPSAVILPDRTVLVIGGVKKYKFDASPDAVLVPELFDPVTNTWTEMASMSWARHYHSVAVLLPDGRVLTTGTTSYHGNDYSMEIYSPPYLFRGPRPRITGYPAAAGQGDEIDVDSPDACRVVDAVLVRPVSMTHHTDSDQRLVALDIHDRGHCWLRLGIPASPALVPPGYYLLFLIDDCGVPSEGKFVKVG